jgi:hypothetical protein
MEKSSKMKLDQIQSSKPKKVTVKFFVNQAVQPALDGKTKRYPLYMLITYDRKNTMMRCHYGQWYKDLKEIEKVHYPGLLDMEERIIRKAIAYEMAQRGKDFDLKGMSKKYDLYAIGIHILLEKHLKGQLWSVLSRMEPYEFAKALNFTDPDVEFSTLYKIAKKVFKDLTDKLPKNFEQEIEIYQAFAKLYQGSFFQYSFPTVIEWLDGTAVDDYRGKLTALYPDSPSTVKKSIDFIDTQVRGVLE